MAIEPNENETTSPLQRLLVGAATLIVIILTVVAAIFLAARDIPDDEPPSPPPATTVVQQVVPMTSTPSPSVTPLPPPEEATPSSTPAPPSPTPEPPSPTPLPPTATSSPTPAPPTATPQPQVIIVTATPVPVAPQTQPAPGGVCQPPPSWIAYTVQAGDTLNDLAARTNTTVFELQQVNCLTTFAIRPGDVISLPFEPPEPTPRPTRAPTGTRLPTPTRTSTPVAPNIREVLVRVNDLDSTVVVVVTGENFRSREQGFRAELVGPTTVELQLGDARTSTSFEATAPVAALDLDGEYDLVVINPNGRLDTMRRVFPPGTPTPTPPPPFISFVTLEGGSISNPDAIRIIVTGSNFDPTNPDFEVMLQLATDAGQVVELEVDQDAPVNSTRFEATIQDPGDPALQVGTYDLVVVNPDGKIARRDDAVTLNP